MLRRIPRSTTAFAVSSPSFLYKSSFAHHSSLTTVRSFALTRPHVAHNRSPITVRAPLFAMSTSSTPTPAPTPTPRTASDPEPAATPKLTLLFDGECPLCVREVDMLRARSVRYGDSLAFVDIAGPDFDDDSFGVDYETAMRSIHGVLPDGSLVSGVSVFRLAYEAVGLGWVYAVIQYKPVYWLAERVYAVWANYRTQLTGRDTLEAIVRARNDKRTCR